MKKTLILSDQKVSIEDIVSLAKKQIKSSLEAGDAYKAKIKKGASVIAELLDKESVIYGVTTGYGDSCTTDIGKEWVYELPLHLTRYHGCGLGAYFNEEETRAILAARLVSLSKGYSGVRYELLSQIHNLISHNILPQIPEEGSVGASGDLTPLSYVAAALIGERDVIVEGKKHTAKEALEKCGLSPIVLYPKEGLALMNGTAVMTALACLCYKRASYLADCASVVTAMTVLALKGNAEHFSSELFKVKPHPGMLKSAKKIETLIQNYAKTQDQVLRLQDRYSVRCAPHVIGVLEECLTSIKPTIEIELNSANDNPIIDPDTKTVLHGGHFYGGHIAYAMDSLKCAIANVADLLDRQLALLVDPKFNHGLPANLSGQFSSKAQCSHGFKAVQITASACTAEALKLTMPASVFSRSTECHNQDKVSMGTIAARDCRRILELTEQVLACHLMAASQAILLRLKYQELTIEEVGELKLFSETILSKGKVVEDRPLEAELRHVIQSIRDEAWAL